MMNVHLQEHAEIPNALIHVKMKTHVHQLQGVRLKITGLPAVVQLEQLVILLFNAHQVSLI